MATRGGQPVGRISAVRDQLHDDFHGDRIGFFGHFEAADQAAAHALLDHASAWLRERGATALRGPVDLSTNYRCGLLLAGGTPGPPTVMMPYNPPHYLDYLESYGLTKAKDLLALLMERRVSNPERFDRFVARVRRRTRAVIRPFDMKRFTQELEVVWALYNQIWERNWGFVPMTEGEFMRSGKELKLVAVPGLLTIVEIDGEPVAFALDIPDANVGTKACNGRLLPFGWWKFLAAMKRNDKARFITLGVLPEYRKSGIDGLLLHYYVHTARDLGYPDAEAGWILEDNHEMMRALENMGGREIRRYRVFEKLL